MADPRKNGNGGLVRVLDLFTKLEGAFQITADDLNRVACLSALIGAGMHVEAENVAKGDRISRGDALAALGMMLIENMNRVGPEVERVLKQIGGVR